MDNDKTAGQRIPSNSSGELTILRNGNIKTTSKEALVYNLHSFRHCTRCTYPLHRNVYYIKM